MKSPGSLIVLSICLLAFCIPLTRIRAQEKEPNAESSPAAEPTPAAASKPDSGSPEPGAPESSRIDVDVAPSQVAIAAMAGSSVTRSVLITTNGPIEDLRFIPLDLGRSDDQGVIPATSITIEPRAKELKANDPMIVPLTFDLRGARGGEFKGVILVQFKGGKSTIPVTLKVKDRWWPPLLALAIGIGLGLIVTFFREKGHPRDKTLIRIGRLRSQLSIDHDLDESFRARVDALLNDANNAINAEKWDQARKSIELAERVVTKWHIGREDWRTQLGYRTELSDRLTELNGAEELPTFLLLVRRGIEEAGRTSPDLAGPDKLQTKLDALAQRLNRYTELSNRLRTLEMMIGDLDHQRDDWQSKVNEWRGALNNLPPDETTTYDALGGEIEAGTAEVKTMIEQGPYSKMSGNGGFDPSYDPFLLSPLSPAPPAKQTVEAAVKAVDRHLRWSKWGISALILLLLAGVGFGELYYAQPTFGADMWGDYFMLLAWGFGSEATRASVTGLMKSLGVPGTK